MGTAHNLVEVSRTLRDIVYDMHPAVVGAHQIACSDESERECVEAFHAQVVRSLLPGLKYWAQSSFRTANLGGRYEPGSLPIAESHYATPPSEDSFKVLVVKVNSHVSMVRHGEEVLFGKKDRYERECVYCGALHELLEGGEGAFVSDLRELFQSGGTDRLAVLQDRERVRPEQRALLAAVVNAKLQSDRAAAEARSCELHSPTVFVIVAAVTINTTDRDVDLVVGVHRIDARVSPPKCEYWGLGDDPARYRVEQKAGRVSVVEE